MNFLQVALDAEKVANTFSKFVAHLPEDAGNITSVVTELFTIGANLRSLEALHNSPLRSNFDYINNDVVVVKASFLHTIRVINGVFLAMDDDGRAQPSHQNVRMAWLRLCDYFHREAGYPLSVRLQYYKQFLTPLV
ncbi:hypothetical protein ACJ72_08312 [Emergomyces africanus]|uniref:Uncharacterized protein n=1 Tax=Emergomyces africanus TaxID=1955775 RepID=A0A1B7NKU7_9EURO|nr:hypothetical protein ACJ72_08312 [Emergomyces africanus]